MNSTVTLVENRAAYDETWLESGLPSTEADMARLHDRVLDFVTPHDQTDLEYRAHAIERQFRHQPHATFMIELSMLSEESEARTLRYTRGLQKMAVFATRTADEAAIDAVYVTIEEPDGSLFHTVETRLSGELEAPLYLTSANDQLRIYQRQWHRGGWQDVYHPIEPGQRGHDLLGRFFDTTLTAIVTAKARTLEERRQSDRQSLGLVNHRLLTTGSPYAEAA